MNKTTTTKKPTPGGALTIWIAPELKREFRIACAHEDTTMSSKVNDLIRSYLAEGKKK